MTAVALFDALREADNLPSDAGSIGRSRATTLAEGMVDALREDFRRLKGYELEFGSLELDEKREFEVVRGLWQAFYDWAREAEAVISRIEMMGPAGKGISGFEALRDDHGFARARLSWSPERIFLSKQQAIRGEVVPAQELRDELRARLLG